MADIKEVNGVYGGVELGTIGGLGDIPENNNSVENGFGVFGNDENNNNNNNNNINNINNSATNLPVKTGFWSKFKAFWLQEIDWNKEIKVELTPYQQKVEDEINEFLHQEITWEKVHDFLFQEVRFGKKKV